MSAEGRPAHHCPDEALAPAPLERLQRDKLARLWAQLTPENEFYLRKFSGVTFDPQRDPLSALPFTTRAELETDQLAAPPYGRCRSAPFDRFVRVHQTSGSQGRPLRWPDTARNWDWWKHCWNIIFHAAGVDAGDTLVFAFSFGPFIGFWSAFEAAASRGCRCLPAGGMTTAARLRYLFDHNATVVCCTPTYALHLAEVAATENLPLRESAVRTLLVAGEPGGNIPATRAAIERAWGARVVDHAGMTEIGPWGFEEPSAPGALHLIESEFIAEVVQPRGDALVADGELGELVLTSLGRIDSPLIRYRTGDLVRRAPRACIAGRWFSRFEGGVLGRADDMLFIRGNNVFPSAIEGILRELEGLAEFRLEVSKRGGLAELALVIEPAAGADRDAVAAAAERAVRDRLNFRPSVRLAAPGELPRFEMKARRLVHTPATGAPPAEDQR